MEPIIKEGQKLEKLLQDQMGEPAKKAIVFELTGEKILDAGDKVNSKHITHVQKSVQKKMEVLENELKDKKQHELEELKIPVCSLQSAGRSWKWKPCAASWRIDSSASSNQLLAPA